MAENSGGYIGNKPSDSSVTIARQAYTSTGVTTDFTFRSGYTPGYLDAYLNGVRLIETDDYVATDGTTLSLTTAAQDGDTLELIAYKAFNVSEFTLETELGGNFNVSNDLTVGGNINLEGNLDLQDNDKILIGTDDDLEIYHNGDNSVIHNVGIGTLYIDSTSDVVISEDSISSRRARFIQDGAVELYYNNSKKFETTSSGIDITGHTELDNLNVSGVSTFSGNLNIGTGATVGFGSTAYFKDNASAFFGDGEDLQIYHDGTNSYVSDVGAGGLKITGGDVYIRNTSDEDMIHASSGSFVKLYHSNSEKLTTTETGSIVTGILTATDFSGASGGAADFPNGLTGTSATFTGSVSIAGTLTYEDVTNIDSIGIVTARDAIVISEDNAIHFRGIATDDNDAILRASAGGGQLLINSRNDAIINIDSNNDSTDAHFAIGHGAATGSSTELFRVQENGRVGIGTENPNYLLDVYKQTGTNQDVFSVRGQTSAFLVQCSDLSAANPTWNLRSFAAEDITIKPGNSESVRFKADGKVGIGITIPTADLEVAGTTGTASTIFINAPTHNSSVVSEAVLKFGYAHSGSPDAVAEIKLVEGSTNSFGGNLTFSVPSNNGSGGSSTSEALRITSGGSVGIGTIIPDSILHIESPAATAGWQVRTDSEGLNNESGFYRDVNDDYECVLRNAEGGLGFIKNHGGLSDPNLHFHVGSTEKVRITHDGKVGINTQNPQAALDVAGTITQRVVEYPTIRSSLDLNFAVTKRLDRRITFTRDSLGTYTDELGVIRYASNNVPRFDHDPTTGESLGLLIESLRTNQFPYSSEFDNSAWNRSNTDATANQITAPDGTMTADKITADATATEARYVNDDTSITSGRVYTQSVFAKAGEITVIQIAPSTGFASRYQNFDLSTGQLGNGDVESASITAYPNGWYRCTVTQTSTVTQSGRMVMSLVSSSTSGRIASSSFNLGDGLYLWGAQLEEGPFASSFIPTTGSAFTREADRAFVRDIREYDWFNQTEGTVFFEHTDVPNSGTAYYPAIGFSETNTVTSSHAIHYFFDTGQDNAYYLVRDSGVDFATIGSNTGFMTAAKVSFVYKENDFALARNGSIVGSDTNGALPDDCFGLALGNNGFNDTQFLNAHIKRFSYYPKRLPNAQLQGLTYQ